MLEAVSSLELWVVARMAILAHAYWFGIGFTSMFSARELYLSIISFIYFFETMALWPSLHYGLGVADDVGKPYPDMVMTLISKDLTQEVSLAAAFFGVLMFHIYYYQGDMAHVGSKLTVGILGFAAPSFLTVIGVRAGAAPLWVYAVSWMAGFCDGVFWGISIAMLLSRRLTLWTPLLRKNPRWGARETIMHHIMLKREMDNGVMDCPPKGWMEEDEEMVVQ